jgi:hypothetical protein
MRTEPFLGALEASKQTVIAELEGWLQYVGAQLPNSVDEIGRGLVSYYLGCNEVLRRAVLGQGTLAQKAGLLLPLNIYQIHDIMSACHSGEVMTNASSTDDRQYEVVYMDGVAAMYRRPAGYTSGWLNFFSENEFGRHERFAIRLFFRRLDEIVAVLGGEPDIREMFFWHEVELEIIRATCFFYDLWDETESE